MKTKTVLKCLLVMLPLIFTTSCSERALSIFFDIPPSAYEEKPKAQVKQAKTKEAAPAKAEAASAVTTDKSAPAAAPVPPVEAIGDTPPPPKKSTAASGARLPIESVATWEEAEAMLPEEANWSEALRQGIINPWRSLTGPEKTKAFVFGFDFFIPGPDKMFDAYFPHSVHTEWLNCTSCHGRIFRTRGIKMSMEKINKGELCGACHGRGVAFPVEDCARCHTGM